MEDSPKPRTAIAKQILPKPLLKCIEQIFEQGITGTALVGGTALAGYYAGHRRSDDIDLFCSSEINFRSAILAVKHLEKTGLSFSNESRSSQFFHVNGLFLGHGFTIDVVVDENLFKVGTFENLPNKVVVASLETLLRMKVATLVSRASEKDLFDIQWLFEKFPMETKKWIQLGRSIDRGVNAENLLASIGGTKLRKEACAFSLDSQDTDEKTYKRLLAFQKKIVQELVLYLKKLPPPPLGRLVRKLK